MELLLLLSLHSLLSQAEGRTMQKYTDLSTSALKLSRQVVDVLASQSLIQNFMNLSTSAPKYLEASYGSCDCETNLT